MRDEDLPKVAVRVKSGRGKVDLTKEEAVPKRARRKAYRCLDHASRGSKIIREKFGFALRVLGETASSRGAGYRVQGSAVPSHSGHPARGPVILHGVVPQTSSASVHLASSLFIGDSVLGRRPCRGGQVGEQGKEFRVQGLGFRVHHAEVALVLKVREELADVLLALGVLPPQSLQYLR